MKLVKDRASIITPCYNAEEFIQRHIDDILNQTYQNIEFILVNDGSTDKTEEIILANKEKLEKRGIIFKYFSYTKNKGQAFALSLGLKHFTGEFLHWMDCDDVMYPNCIEEKVNFLRQNPQCGFCSADVKIIHEENVPHKNYHIEKLINKKNIFWELLFLNYMPFHTMTRSEAFLSVVPDREIYPGLAGQNLQMLLPLAYRYEYGFIDKILTEYIQHTNSHSHNIKDRAKHNFELLRTMDKTLEKLEMDPDDKMWVKNVLSVHKKNCIRQTLLGIKRKFIPFNIKKKFISLFTR